MIFTLYLIILLINQSENIPKHSQLEGRIIGGIETNIKEIPFHVSLWNGVAHFCGAALISNQWAITAAHCTGVHRNYQIRYNSSDATSGGTLINVTNEIIHPDYDTNLHDYDVGLLKIDRINITSGIRYARFPKCLKKEYKPGDIIEVSGWGVNNITDPKKKVILQSVRLPLINQTECQNIYKKYTDVTDRMFCAGLEAGGKDACHGDSGGPAIHRGDLIGIVSWGIGCAQEHSPGVYTNLMEPDIKKWIKDVTGIQIGCVDADINQQNNSTADDKRKKLIQYLKNKIIFNNKLQRNATNILKNKSKIENHTKKETKIKHMINLKRKLNSLRKTSGHRINHINKLRKLKIGKHNKAQQINKSSNRNVQNN